MVFNTRYSGEGKEDGGPGVEEEEHVQALFTMLAHLYSFCISDNMPWMRGLDLEGHEKNLKEATRVIAMYHDPIIHERIKQWREGKKEQPEDLLDVLVSLKDDNGDSLLSAEVIKAQIIGKARVHGSSMTTMLFARILHGFSWSIPSDEGRIDLSEDKGNLHLARLLVAVAKPRLLQHVYPC
ncbi:Cytochrome P450 [Corchorus capsularis]|uniref:Cytochrome P450 n=1 Tax=Corchorus capsularis TaxID=210143 RepID=A0A1R3IVC0_COCAP|nr:Cytochrome P450 [Corchorus capsularis]